MKYSASPLTPFPPTFLRIPRTTHVLSTPRNSHDRRNSNLLALCFHALADSCLPRASKGTFSKKPTPSPSSKSSLFLQNTRGGIPRQHFVSCAKTQKCQSASPLLATLTHSLSRNSFPCHSYANTQDDGPTLSKFFSPLATRHSPLLFLNTFRINTCKSVSKQRTLTSFRINTYAKTGGRGPPVLS
jgi:hypothetical protein